MGPYDPLTSDTPLRRVARVGFRSVALTDDQKAMLRLLAQREEGYDDMAALMGISVEEVRARVKEALPRSRSRRRPPSRRRRHAHRPRRPHPHRPWSHRPSRSRSRRLPSPPRHRRRHRLRRPGRPRGQPSPLARLRSSKDRGALIGVGAGALVVLILVDRPHRRRRRRRLDSSSTTSSADGGTSLTAAEESKLTQAVLAPTDGSDASGQAPSSAATRRSVLLQVEAEGLEPSPPGETYTIWLYRSPKLVLRIGAVRGQRGRRRQARRPASDPGPGARPTSPAAPSTRSTSRCTSNAAYKAALAKAKAERKLPPYTGESVLRGEITGPAIQQAVAQRSSLPGFMIPVGIEPLLDRAQHVEPGCAHLGLHVGGVVAADGVVVGDRAAGGDDRLAGGTLDLPATARSPRPGGRGR